MGPFHSEFRSFSGTKVKREGSEDITCSSIIAMEAREHHQGKEFYTEDILVGGLLLVGKGLLVGVLQGVHVIRF